MKKNHIIHADSILNSQAR